MKKEEAERRFEEYRKYLLYEAQRLTSFIRVYRQLKEMDGNRRRAMRYAPAFFSVTEDALFSAIVIWTDKLFDIKSQRGFADFLRFVDNNKSILAVSELQRRKSYPDGHWMLDRKPITAESIQEDRHRIQSVMSLASFKIRRDKFHAHFDSKYFFQRSQIQQDAPLKWGDLEEIEETMGQIINRYSAAYDGSLHRLRLGNISDLGYFLDRVRPNLG